MKKSVIIASIDKQRANNLLSAQIQPQYFIKTKLGWSPRNFKQMKAYLNLIGWDCGEVKRMGIYLNLTIHNESLQQKMNGIKNLRVCLDAWTLKFMLQTIELLTTAKKRTNQPQHTVQKFTKFPKYFTYLKLAKQKRNGRLPRGSVLMNNELKSDLKKAWGETP